jgi:hypothetical protein
VLARWSLEQQRSADGHQGRLLPDSSCRPPRRPLVDRRSLPLSFAILQEARPQEARGDDGPRSIAWRPWRHDQGHQPSADDGGDRPKHRLKGGCRTRSGSMAQSESWPALRRLRRSIHRLAPQTTLRSPPSILPVPTRITSPPDLRLSSSPTEASIGSCLGECRMMVAMSRLRATI